MTENGDCTGLRPRPRGRGLSPLSVEGSHSGLSGWIRNVPGSDITVFDDDSVADGYWFYAGNDWAGPWTSLGHANGTTSFDLGSAGLDSARYLRIVCDSTGSSLDPKAGLDLDAVSYRSVPAALLSPSPHAPRPLLTVFPNPTSRLLYVAVPPAGGRLEIIDILGRAVKCYSAQTRDITQFRRGIGIVSQVPVADLAPGVYLARLETAAGTSQYKFVVARP